MSAVFGSEVACAGKREQLGCPGLPNVCLGKFSHTVERCLQLSMMMLLISIRGDTYWPADPHQRARKWHGNHAAVPGFQHPCTLVRDVKHNHGRSRAARQA